MIYHKIAVLIENSTMTFLYLYMRPVMIFPPNEFEGVYHCLSFHVKDSWYVVKKLHKVILYFYLQNGRKLIQNMLHLVESSLESVVIVILRSNI